MQITYADYSNITDIYFLNITDLQILLSFLIIINNGIKIIRLDYFLKNFYKLSFHNIYVNYNKNK